MKEPASMNGLVGLQPFTKLGFRFSFRGPVFTHAVQDEWSQLLHNLCPRFGQSAADEVTCGQEKVRETHAHTEKTACIIYLFLLPKADSSWGETG